MKKIVIILLLFAGILANSSSFAQTKEFKDVRKFRVRSSTAIIEDNAVKGYAFFLMVEKEDKKNVHYLLQILDENLREVNSTPIVRPSSYILIESAWNGTAFAFVFMDYKNKTIEFLTFDKTCKQIGSKKLTELKKRELAVYAQSVGTGEDNSTETIHAVKNKGFLRITPVKNDSWGYDIEMLSNELKVLWTGGSPAAAKDVQMASLADMTETHALVQIYSKPNAASRDASYKLICYKIEDGKKVFDVPLDDSKYNLAEAGATFDSKGNIVLLGEYFALNDKSDKAKSLGFYAGEIGMDGAFKTKKFISWAKDVSKLVPVNEKGKIDNEAYVYFHKILRLDNGKLIAIGEQYKIAASAAGIASKLLGGSSSSASLTAFVTLNMMVFEFNPDFTLASVKIFEKDKTKITLPNGTMAASARFQARYIDYLGLFDYVYTQVSPDGNEFTSSYVNYDREKGEKNKNVAGTIIYADGKYSEDKFPLEKGKTYYWVAPAKPGYLLISEYSKREKTLSLRLEKFNY